MFAEVDAFVETRWVFVFGASLVLLVVARVHFFSHSALGFDYVKDTLSGYDIFYFTDAAARWDGNNFGSFLVGELRNALPINVQIHGVVVLNQLLIFLLSLVLGKSEFSIYFLSLGYAIVIYACWAALLKKHFGGGCFLIFSILHIFASGPDIRGTSLTMGSHPEGAAVFAVMNYLVFARPSVWRKYLWLILGGTFFFLYKPAAVLMLVLAIPCFAALETWKNVLTARWFFSRVLPSPSSSTAAPTWTRSGWAKQPTEKRCSLGSIFFSSTDSASTLGKRRARISRGCSGFFSASC
ncbi:MAG: hypothetical protein M5R36_14610 [Deltaproteobacteria bacterium]|nr:hypothetical protein [Deltaproteobacteria bacterium]